MNTWCYWVRKFVTSVKYWVLINGDHIEWINGVRKQNQACPLSFYLFILCSKFLYQLNRYNGLDDIKIAAQCPTLTHLLYANGILILLKENGRNIITIRDILVKYSKVIGQKVNHRKSMVLTRI